MPIRSAFALFVRWFFIYAVKCTPVFSRKSVLKYSGVKFGVPAISSSVMPV